MFCCEAEIDVNSVHETLRIPFEGDWQYVNLRKTHYRNSCQLCLGKTLVGLLAVAGDADAQET